MTLSCLTCTLLVIALELAAFAPTAFKPLPPREAALLDDRAQRGRTASPNTNLVFLAITQIAYRDLPLELDSDAQKSWTLQAMREDFPWNRRVWAELIERLANAGAKVVAFDLVFASESEGDPEFKAALEKHTDRVVVGSMFNFTDSAKGGAFSLTGPSPSLIESRSNAATFFDPRVGFVNFLPHMDGNTDGVIRHARFRISDARLNGLPPSEPYHESLAARILRQAGAGDKVPGDELPHRFRYTGAPGQHFKQIAINEVFVPSLWTNNFASGEYFRDKIILVGPAASVFQDAHATPFAATDDKMLGPEIHLNVINAALQGEFLKDLPIGSRLLLDGLMGVMAAVMAVLIGKPLKRMIVVLFALVGCYLFAQWCYDHAGVAVNSIAPMLVLGGSGLTTFWYDFRMEQRARLQMRTTFAYYFSPKILETVLANPGSMEPREAKVTLLLTDLRNSTPLAEKLGPQGMFKLLNRIFEAQTNAIMEEEGNLEHFLGDQFLSYWGAPQEQPDAADRALRAARKLIIGMEDVRNSLPEGIKEFFGYGVALHHGPALVGNKGSSKRLDYGLVGDTVNAAARIESLTKFYCVKMLVSGEFLAHLQTPAITRRIDVVIVKGKSHPVELHQADVDGTSDWVELDMAYSGAFKSYQSGQFSEARAIFEKLASNHGDPASHILAERCRKLEANPPTHWNGIWEMDQK